MELRLLMLVNKHSGRLNNTSDQIGLSTFQAEALRGVRVAKVAS